MMDMKERQYFRQALASGGFLVSDCILGRTNNRPLLVASFAYGEGPDGPAGVVHLGIDRAWLETRGSNAVAASGGTLVVLDRAGTVLIRRPEPEGFGGGRPPLALRPGPDGSKCP